MQASLFQQTGCKPDLVRWDVADNCPHSALICSCESWKQMKFAVGRFLYFQLPKNRNESVADPAIVLDFDMSQDQTTFTKLSLTVTRSGSL